MLPNIRKILYATDMGPGSAQAFRYAFSMARQYGAEITLLHVVEPLSPFGQSLVELHISHSAAEALHLQARERLKDDLVRRLAAFCEEESPEIPSEEHPVRTILVEEGQPAETILAQARALGADLIVMGTHHHSLVREALMGTTAQKVLHSSEIPVLLSRIASSDRAKAA